MVHPVRLSILNRVKPVRLGKSTSFFFVFQIAILRQGFGLSEPQFARYFIKSKTNSEVKRNRNYNRKIEKTTI